LIKCWLRKGNIQENVTGVEGRLYKIRAGKLYCQKDFFSTLRGTLSIFLGMNRNTPKLNLFRLFFGLFRDTKKHFFWFVSVFWIGRNNQNQQNFLKTNRKNLQKMFSIRGSSKPLIFFLGSNRKKPKLNLFRLFLVFFSFFFLVCFALFRCFGLV
jgi:hypothetical protein